MRFMVIVKATKDSEAGEMPSTELLAAMGKYNEELVKAGIMLAGEGLHPSSKGARVRFSGPKRTVIDGPFAETKELIAGFWIWQVRSLDEAIEWVKRCPNPMNEDSDIEIRQIFEAEDFGEALHAGTAGAGRAHPGGSREADQVLTAIDLPCRGAHRGERGAALHSRPEHVLAGPGRCWSLHRSRTAEGKATIVRVTPPKDKVRCRPIVSSSANQSASEGRFGLPLDTAEMFRITATLPARDNSPQYRMRNDDERYERVTTEDNLEEVATPPAMVGVNHKP